MSKKTILIVDDEPLIRELLQVFLGDMELEFLEASDGLQALEVIDAHPNLNLVISDVKMPKMNGEELLRELNQRASDIPIVMISGYSDLSIEDAKNLNAVTLLPKPFLSREIIEIVKLVLEGKPLPERGSPNL